MAYLATLPAFLLYFGAAIALLAAFLVVYVYATPQPEFALIRAGNAAAAVSLGGAVLGFVLPLASVIVHSLNVADMAVWGAVALLVQIAAFFAARLLLPGLPERIAAGSMAHAAALAALTLGVGILNAACITY